MNKVSRACIQQELTTLCEILVNGATIEEICRRTDSTMTTVRARKVTLLRYGVQISSVVKKKGFNTKIFRLDETLQNATQKVNIRYENKEKNGEEPKNKTTRDSSGKSGREKGWGIESWFFMTSERSNKYIDWCDPWTVEEQRRKR